MANQSLSSRTARPLFSGPKSRPAGKGAQTMSGMPAGPGIVGTASNPSPSMPGVTTGLKRAKTPNSGGIIQRTGGPARTIAPDAGYTGPTATGFGDNPDQPGSWKPETPVNRPPGTERANPLTNGGGAPQVEGTSRPVAAPVDAGRALGYSQRGSRVPSGQDLGGGAPAPDALADSRSSIEADLSGARESVQRDLNPGGMGRMTRNFSNPTSANMYQDFTRNLFGDGGGPGGPKAATGLKRSPSGEKDEDQSGDGDY